MAKKTECNVELAVMDYLTKLPNRHGMYDFYQAIDKSEVITLMFMDIDNFKKVNDNHGHSMGDELLIEVSNQLKKVAKKASVFRIGGDEFVLIFVGKLSEKKVIELACTIQESKKELNVPVDVKALISFSVGVISNQSAAEDLNELLYKSDAAMYQVKKNGKGGYLLYNSIEKELLYKKSVEREMRDALKNGEFQIFIQPQINMVNSKVIGGEALVRWVHPEDGVRLPGSFLSVLEENGFIVEMDMYVFEEVCKQRAQWRGTPLGEIPTCVNMSKLHLYEKNFVQDLIAITEKYDVQPSEIIVEMSECLEDHHEELKETFAELKQAGFKTAIDDFGTGHLALSMLADTEMDVLKLDEGLLTACEQNNKSKVIVKNVIKMAKELRLHIIAEGVNNKTQERLLLNWGCDMAQGYYYCKPAPVEEFEYFYTTRMNSTDGIIRYHFCNHLLDESGTHVGKMNGNVEFAPGIIDGVGSVKFIGGEQLENVVQLPDDIFKSDSFTLGMWIKPEELTNWTSVFFAHGENGFISIMPYAWEKVPMFRVKDEFDDSGWYDATGEELKAGEWTYICVTYNAKTALGRIYQNGEIKGKRNDMFQVSQIRQVVLGGDYYKEGFKGCISEFMLCNHTMTDKEIKEIYDSYVNNPSFKGRKKEH